ncbi:hypothetical protein [Pseudophaeobacter flagellatus]|uniref:hypothetical protein n=1 Tax=Pseudophaeobacter flagellatus TaxID=2899119 RepID=UPI001E2BD815|nr:hypothetical protein [Pseudophaeobacter flagellatus]MCD9148870.1 hypothetical protein [Pseudophaeobacter flagellatus]
MMIQGSMTQELMSNLYKKSTKMNEEQAAKLAEFLSSFDGDNLLDENARTVVFQVREQDLAAGPDLAASLAGAGGGAAERAAQAGIGASDRRNGPPAPPQETQGVATVDDAVVQLIADAVEAYDGSQPGDATLGQAVQAALEQAGYDSSQSQIDFYS